MIASRAKLSDAFSWMKQEPSPRRVLLLSLGLEVLWLSFWPIARFLDAHAPFTDDFLFRFPLIGSLFRFLTGWAERLLIGQEMGETAAWLALWYSLGLLIYVAAVRCLQSASTPRIARLVLAASVFFQATFFLEPVLFTTDLFSYAGYGEIQAAGFNPYTVVPLDFPDKEVTWLIPSLWRDAPSIYGPLWNLMSYPIGVLTAGDPVAAALAYKSLVNVSHLVTVVGIWLLLGRFGPGRQAAGTALYAWNPAVLVEFAANGHNDATMVGFVVLGLALASRRRMVLSLLALAGSVAIKYTSVISLPFWLFLWARSASTRRGALIRLVAGGLLALGAVLLAYAPYWRGPDTLGPVIRWLGGPMYANTALEYVEGWLSTVIGAALPALEAPEGVAAQSLRWFIRVVFAAYLLFEATRVRSVLDLAGATARAFTVFLLFVNTWVMPWYLLWAAAMAAVIAWDTLTARWVTITGIIGSAVIYYFHFGDRTVPVEAIHLLSIPAAAALIWWLRGRLPTPVPSSWEPPGLRAPRAVPRDAS